MEQHTESEIGRQGFGTAVFLLEDFFISKMGITARHGG
jgi:hypothetical protein